MNERRLIARAMLALALLGLLALLVVGWQFARGPQADAAPPSVRVARLAPGDHLWADAPALPRGVQLPPDLRLKVLLLREPEGTLRAFYAVARQGRPTLPVSEPPASLSVAGMDCEDFAPDMQRRDIACRQAAPDMAHALQRRWALDGRPLTPGTPALPVAAGQEVAGDWRPDLQAPLTAAAPPAGMKKSPP